MIIRELLFPHDTMDLRKLPLHVLATLHADNISDVQLQSMDPDALFAKVCDLEPHRRSGKELVELLDTIRAAAKPEPQTPAPDSELDQLKAHITAVTAINRELEEKLSYANKLRVKLRKALVWAIEWVDATPKDSPRMPGFDRNYVANLIAESSTPITPAPAPQVGKLFEMNPTSPAKLAAQRDFASAAETIRSMLAESAKCYGDSSSYAVTSPNAIINGLRNRFVPALRTETMGMLKRIIEDADYAAEAKGDVDLWEQLQAVCDSADPAARMDRIFSPSSTSTLEVAFAIKANIDAGVFELLKTELDGVTATRAEWTLGTAGRYEDTKKMVPVATAEDELNHYGIVRTLDQDDIDPRDLREIERTGALVSEFDSVSRCRYVKASPDAAAQLSGYTGPARVHVAVRTVGDADWVRDAQFLPKDQLLVEEAFHQFWIHSSANTGRRNVFNAASLNIRYDILDAIKTRLASFSKRNDQTGPAPSNPDYSPEI